MVTGHNGDAAAAAVSDAANPIYIYTCQSLEAECMDTIKLRGICPYGDAFTGQGSCLHGGSFTPCVQGFRLPSGSAS